MLVSLVIPLRVVPGYEDSPGLIRMGHCWQIHRIPIRLLVSSSIKRLSALRAALYLGACLPNLRSNKTRSAKSFKLCELGQSNFCPANQNSGRLQLNLSSIDWVIVGGESGFGARPMQVGWVREIRDSCIEASVPFFFKQWGGRKKKQSGRILDGRTWDEYPLFNQTKVLADNATALQATQISLPLN